MLFTLHRASTLREILTIVLATLLALPPTALAVDDPAKSSLAAEGAQPPVARITSYAQAVQFANGVLDKVREEVVNHALPDGTTLRAELVHYQGAAISPYYDWVLKYLHHASIKVGNKTVNIEVAGDYVTAAAFNQSIENFQNGISTSEALAAYRLNYIEATGDEPSGEFESLSLWTKVKTSLQWFSDKIFGAPYGLTILSALTQKEQVVQEDGSVKSVYQWRFTPDADVSRTARSVTGVGMVWIVGMRIIGGWLTRADAQGWERITDVGDLRNRAISSFYDPAKGVNFEFLAILAVVGVFVYTALTFSREIDLVRRFGGKVKTDPGAEPGKQITVVANDRGYLAACTTQECALNSLILIVQSYFGTATWGAYALIGKVFNGALAAFSYLAMEEIRGGMLQEAERVRQTDPVKAASLSTSARRLGTFFWNLPFPIANNAAQFLQGWWSKAPLVILGGAGFAYRTWKRVLPRRAVSVAALEDIGLAEGTETSAAVSCPDFLVIRAVRPGE